MVTSNSKHCKQIGKDNGLSYQLESVASRYVSFYWWAQWSLCKRHAHMLTSLKTVLLNWCAKVGFGMFTTRSSNTQKCYMDNFGTLGHGWFHGFAGHSGSRCVSPLFTYSYSDNFSLQLICMSSVTCIHSNSPDKHLSITTANLKSLNVLIQITKSPRETIWLA